MSLNKISRKIVKSMFFKDASKHGGDVRAALAIDHLREDFAGMTDEAFNDRFPIVTLPVDDSEDIAITMPEMAVVC